MINSTKPVTVDLKDWSHIKIGDVCHDFYLPDSIAALAQCIKQCNIEGKKIVALGGGSNILFGNTSSIAIISDHKLPCYWNKDQYIKVSGNMNITRLIMELSSINFGGLEFLAGIPAHISGLVKMNAGAWGDEICHYIHSVTAMDTYGTLTTIKKDDIEFGYRKSNISGYITEIELDLPEKGKDDIIKSVSNNIAQRVNKQPLTSPNLGSIFKNPAGDSAGRLLDTCGFKGKKEGDAAFSDIHANIMINNGQATFADASKLIDGAKKTVLEKFNIELKLEIEVVNS